MIIDSHCHIDFEAFDADQEKVLERAQQSGIEHIIVPGVSAETWPRIKSVCEQHNNLHPCYGLHPYYIEEHKHDDLGLLETWIKKEKPIAIGECGLDYFLKDLNKEKQMDFFQSQLDIALKNNLPVVLHSRKATEQVIQEIKTRPGLRGMIHSYSGSYEQALQLIDLGFYLSFGGAITYDRATRLREIVSKIPLDNLLIETDAPDQPDLQHYKQRNEPAYINNVIETLSHIRKQSIETICKQTSHNCKQLLSL